MNKIALLILAVGCIVAGAHDKGLISFGLALLILAPLCIAEWMILTRLDESK